ncbi:unnamed protein product [Gulo gulo]|uniref:Uncharacterized protein n=1 Tax=Gulo gulo TaxID=48420 RepID=A0A9X9LFU3_GULGU|nr:unnamed protein product [Gulo gulo]
MDEVRAKTGTKDLINIMTKDTVITIVPMAVIKTIVAMTAMIILGITMELWIRTGICRLQWPTEHIRQGISRGWQSPKQLPVILEEDTGENRRKLLKLTHLAGRH